MLKGKYVLRALAVVLVCWQVAGVNTVNSGIIDSGKSSVRSGFLTAIQGPNGSAAGPCDITYPNQAGIVMACPLGDGDQLTSPSGGGNCQITLVVRDASCVGIAGVPAVDMWLVGCNDGLLLCGGSQGSQADHDTGNGNNFPLGETTFSNEPAAGGCDTGVYVVVQGTLVGSPATCLPIAVRSIDYKSAGAPGPAPCGGDIRCPDGKVTNADFSWFVTHYPTGANPGATYFACADYTAPFGGPIGLADFAKFTVHFAGAGHKCP
jgi:hypothetical protein